MRLMGLVDRGERQRRKGKRLREKSRYADEVWRHRSLRGTSFPEPALQDQVEKLVDELVGIGASRGASYDRNPGYAHDSPYASRVKAIGRELDEIGGRRLMLVAHAEVSEALGSHAGYLLDTEWDGIGEWLG